MGLGQVRDLRHSAVAAIIAARAAGPFIGPNDLLARADLQPKEIVHLVQCGALDGLGPSRAALLAEAEEYRRCGRPGQMAFEFPPPEVAPESAGQRLAWERHILGWPVSVHPLDLVRDRLPEHVPLRRLPEVPGRPVTVVGVRLPGWTGGPGFYLGDGDTFIIVRPPRSSAGPPSPWQPLVVRGRWIGDEWGTFWLEASEPIQKLQDLE